MERAELELMKTRIDALNSMSDVNRERADSMFEVLGELQGMISNRMDKLEEINELFDNTTKFDFDKDNFVNKLDRLQNETDILRDKVEEYEDKAGKLMPLLQEFLDETKFIGMFDVTSTLRRETDEMFARIKNQRKTFKVGDYAKIYRKHTSLMGKIQKLYGKITTLKEMFIDINRKYSHLEARVGFLVSLKDHAEGKKRFHTPITEMGAKMEKLRRKIDAARELPDPNFLFIGRSLHNYVSQMIEKGYRDDYIVDYLDKYGVQRELSKMVLAKINKG